MSKTNLLSKETRTLLQCIQFPIILLNTKFEVLEINEPALKIYHWEHKNTLQENIFSLCNKTQSQPPTTTEALQTALSLANTSIYLATKIIKTYQGSISWHVSCAENIIKGKKTFILSGQPLSQDLTNLFCKDSYQDLITKSMTTLIKHMALSTKQGSMQRETKANFKFLSFNKGIYFDDIVKLLPGEVYWEDKNLIYLGCNDYCAEVIGLNGTSDIVGQNDCFIKKVMGSNYPQEAYNLWRQTARSVMEQNTVIINTPDLTYNHPDTGEEIKSRTSKIPIVDSNGNIIGMVGVSTNQNNPEHIKQMIKADKILQQLMRADVRENTLSDLSPQELKCVESRAKGKSMKQTALELNLSPRTVETYLNKARVKTGCPTASQLSQLYWQHSDNHVDLGKILQM
jgi:DNA-binding CsgD family transcriptional regulator/PAS domain-containing protein